MRTSNTVKMTASWELAQPGRLHLESDELMPTRVYIGNVENEVTSFPYDIGNFNQHEIGALDFYLTSTNMSATGNVGNYRLRFIPDEGEEQMESADVRIVKIRVEADADWPSNKVRHVFGPKEQFSIQFPESQYKSIKVNATQDIGYHTICVTNSDLVFNVDYRVIPPVDIRGEFIRSMSAMDWIALNRDPFEPGVCGVGFVAAWYLLPDYVSFANIYVVEGFAPMSSMTGCFLDTTLYPPNVYGHDADAGANSPMDVAINNRVGGATGYDNIGVQFGNPPTSSGSFNLSIPWRWGDNRQTCNYLIRYVDQTTAVDGNGNTTIRKLNLQYTRNAFE